MGSDSVNYDELYESGYKQLVQSLQLFKKCSDNNHSLGERAFDVIKAILDVLPETCKSGLSKYQIKADNGDPEAQFYVGVMLDRGEGCKPDPKLAAHYYKLASDAGIIPARNYLAVMYHRGRGVARDNNRAVELFLSAAEGGLPSAQYCLGLMYENGDGVEQDYAKAIDYYTKAADQGDVDACCNLAAMYFNGKGTERNLAEAAKFFKRGALQNDADCQFNYARMLYKGEGVKRNREEAGLFFKNAADRGSAEAMFCYASMIINGSLTAAEFPEEITKHYLEKASEKNHPYATLYLAMFYRAGRFGLRNPETAIDLYEKAMKLGVPEACSAYAEMLFNGEGCEPDKKKAHELFEKSAKQGDPLSLAWLGEIGLVNGEKNKAIDLLKKSVDMKCCKGLFDMGLMFLFGRYVKQDRERGAEMLKEAADKPEASAELCNFVSTLFAKGIGFEADKDRAAYYASLADKRGSTPMYFELLFSTEEEKPKTIDDLISIL